MLVKEGQLVKIEHVRKGTFVAVALRDFDSEEEIYLPLALAEGYVEGLSRGWAIGESIPCRARLVQIVELLPSGSGSEGEEE